MKKITIALISLMCVVMPAQAQNLGNLLGAILGAVAGEASAVMDDSESKAGLPQQALAKWGIEAANYSGITPLGGGRYAVVSDKGSADGFYVWKIEQDKETGAILSVENEGFFANKVDAVSNRDCEGIVFVPRSGTVFISGEGDQRVLEYDMDGQRTGRELVVPEIFTKVVGNQGLEALGYMGRGRKGIFWSTTETSLPADGAAAGPKAPGKENLMRIQSFKGNLRPFKQYAYRMDAGRSSDFGTTYVFGIPEVCALPDGCLLVLEREANIPSVYVGAEVVTKIYKVNPKVSTKITPDTSLSSLDEGDFMAKTLVTSWTTRLSITNLAWANYEGMCLGARLSDGRRTLILVSDSQGGYGKGSIHLQDFIKVVVLE